MSYTLPEKFEEFADARKAGFLRVRDLKEQGKTIIVSTHIFSLIEKICDRVGIIINGRMILCDTLERVMDGKSMEDRFFELYKETVGDKE